MKDYITIDRDKLHKELKKLLNGIAPDWITNDLLIADFIDQATVPAKPKEHSVECKKYKTICTCDYFNKPDSQEEWEVPEKLDWEGMNVYNESRELSRKINEIISSLEQLKERLV